MSYAQKQTKPVFNVVGMRETAVPEVMEFVKGYVHPLIRRWHTKEISSVCSHQAPPNSRSVARADDFMNLHLEIWEG